MSKTIKKFRRDRDYFDEYGYYSSENDNKKQARKKERRSKYYDEIDTYEYPSKYNSKTQKYRF
jgi:hypothetical protein